jgi:hypothetical protein
LRNHDRGHHARDADQGGLTQGELASIEAINPDRLALEPDLA